MLFKSFHLILYSGIIFSLLGILDIFFVIFKPNLYIALHSLDNAGNGTGASLGAYGNIFRSRGYFVEPNEFTQYLLLPIGYLFSKFYVSTLYKSTVKNTSYAIYGVILIAGMLSTFSRGGLLGIFGMLLALLAFSFSMHQKDLEANKSLNLFFTKLFKLGLLIFIFCIILIYIFDIDLLGLVDLFILRFFSLFSSSDYSANFRFEVIQTGLNIISQDFMSLFFGIGPGNLDVSLVSEATTGNQFIDIIVETGLFGLFCYLLIVIYAVRKFFAVSAIFLYKQDYQSLQVSLGFFLGLIGLMFGGMTYSTHSLFFFWINLSLLFASIDLVNINAEHKNFVEKT